MSTFTEAITNIQALVLAPLAASEALAIATAGRLSVVARTLMDIFLVIIVVVTGIRYALSNSLQAKDFFFEFMKLLVLWSAIYWMVGSYTHLIDRFYDGFARLSQVVEQEATRAIADAAGGLRIGDAGDGGNPATPGIGAFTGIGSLLNEMENARTAAFAAIDNNTEANMRGVHRVGSNLKLVMHALWVKAQINVLHIATVIVLLVYVVLYALVISVLGFLKAIVIAIGPILLVFFLVPYLSFVADGWVRAAIVIGLIYVVLSIIMSLFAGLMVGAMAGVGMGGANFARMTTEQIDAHFSLIKLAPTILFALVGAFMMLMAPRIAEMLVMGRGAGIMVGQQSGSAARTGGTAAQRGAGAAAGKLTAAGKGLGRSESVTRLR